MISTVSAFINRKNFPFVQHFGKQFKCLCWSLINCLKKGWVKGNSCNRDQLRIIQTVNVPENIMILLNLPLLKSQFLKDFFFVTAFIIIRSSFEIFKFKY